MTDGHSNGSDSTLPAPKPGERRYNIDPDKREVLVQQYGPIALQPAEVIIPFYDIKRLMSNILAGEAAGEVYAINQQKQEERRKRGPRLYRPGE